MKKYVVENPDGSVSIVKANQIMGSWGESVVGILNASLENEDPRCLRLRAVKDSQGLDKKEVYVDETLKNSLLDEGIIWDSEGYVPNTAGE